MIVVTFILALKRPEIKLEWVHTIIHALVRYSRHFFPTVLYLRYSYRRISCVHAVVQPDEDLFVQENLQRPPDESRDLLSYH